MKKVLFSVLLIILGVFVLSGCENENSGNLPLDNETLSNPELSIETTMSSMSVGELHNAYLDQMYDYLRQQVDLGPSTINEHSRNFFLTLEYSDLINENYLYAVNNEIVEYAFPIKFNLEIETLHDQLEASDFTNINEFQEFVSAYVPQHITEYNELIAWGFYTDVFLHSGTYWATNLEMWESLTPLANNDKCKEGNWWKRTWCNIKRYGSIDAGAAATTTITLYFGPNPVTLMGVVGASLGASTGAIIKDLIF